MVAADVEPPPLPTRFERDGHTLWWGDALTVLAQHVPRQSVDLIFVDPPYNIGKSFANDRWPADSLYLAWCEKWLDLCIDLLKPTGSMYVMASTQHMPALDLYLRQKITILSRLVWTYDSSGVQAKKHFGSLYEPLLFCVKDRAHYTFNAHDILVEAKTGAQRKLIDHRGAAPKPYNDKKVPGNVWYFPRVRFRMPEYAPHPSQKPEALLERVIRASSCPGDVVLDPFAGTFTTSSVAARLGRRSIGVEVAAEFVRIGLRRLGFPDDVVATAR